MRHRDLVSVDGEESLQLLPLRKAARRQGQAHGRRMAGRGRPRVRLLTDEEADDEVIVGAVLSAPPLP